MCDCFLRRESCAWRGMGRWREFSGCIWRNWGSVKDKLGCCLRLRWLAIRRFCCGLRGFRVARGRLGGGGTGPLRSLESVLGGYAVSGVVLAVLFWGVSGSVEVGPVSPDVSGRAGPTTENPRRLFGLGESRGIVARLSGLFA